MDFTPTEKALIDLFYTVRYGKVFMGAGEVGEVYELDNFPGLVIKVPRGYFAPDRNLSTFFSRQMIETEVNNYSKLKDLSIIAPMRTLNLGTYTAEGGAKKRAQRAGQHPTYLMNLPKHQPKL